MANKWDRFKENKEGAFYIDENCINCGLCASILSSVFVALPQKSIHIVQKQPTQDEWVLAKEAEESCPALAIGCDG